MFVCVFFPFLHWSSFCVLLKCNIFINRDVGIFSAKSVFINDL